LTSVSQLNVTFESLLGIGASDLSSSKQEVRKTSGYLRRASSLAMKQTFVAVERITLVVLAVGASILFPDFSSLMAVLGSSSASIICIIGPISAKVAMERRCTVLDAALLLVFAVMAVWGTAAAFWSTAE